MTTSPISLHDLSIRQILNSIDTNLLKFRDKGRVSKRLVSNTLKFIVGTFLKRRDGRRYDNLLYFRMGCEKLSDRLGSSICHMGKVLTFLVEKELLIRKRLNAGKRDTTYFYALNEEGLLSFLNLSLEDEPTSEKVETYVLGIQNTSLNTSEDFDRKARVSGIQNTDRLSGDVPPCYAPNTGFQRKGLGHPGSSFRPVYTEGGYIRVEALAEVITKETGLKFEGTAEGLQGFYRYVRAAFKTMFSEHMESWTDYWRKVWDSDLLMGRYGKFKAKLGWLLRFPVINRILEGFTTIRDFMEEEASERRATSSKRSSKGRHTDDSENTLYDDLEWLRDDDTPINARKEKSTYKASSRDDTYEPDSCARWGTGTAKLGAEYSWLKRNYSWEREEAPPPEAKRDDGLREGSVICLPFTSALPIHDPIVEWDIPCDPIIEYEEFDI